MVIYLWFNSFWTFIFRSCKLQRELSLHYKTRPRLISFAGVL